MKILFVQPNSTNDVVNNAMHIYNFEPLGLYYLASTVKNNHDVSLLDLNNELIFKKKINGNSFIETINSFKPNVVAFSALTSVRTGKTKELSKIVKNIDKSIITLVGGIHSSLYPDDFKTKDIDIVLINNSIHNFSRIIDYLDKNKNIDKINQKFILDNKEKNNFKNWPKPKREIGDKYEGFYRIAIGRPGYSKIYEPISSIKTSMGCPFRCNFCCLWELYPEYLTRKTDSVVEEIESLKHEYVFFADDESLVNVNYMTELSRALKKSGIKKKYIMYGRSDTISKNPALLEKLKEIGLTQIWIGIEGFNDKYLEEYRKRNTTKSHLEAIEICKKLGIDVHATTIVDQNFKKQDFDYMLNYTKEILKLTSCHFFILTPFKGTNFYNQIKKSSYYKLLTDNSDHFSIRQSVIKPNYMTIEEFHKKYADLQRDFNSDTMPLEKREAKISRPSLENEFFYLVKKNEELYRAILSSHTKYKIGVSKKRKHKIKK